MWMVFVKLLSPAPWFLEPSPEREALQTAKAAARREQITARPASPLASMVSRKTGSAR
jgi:hypothetical protein